MLCFAYVYCYLVFCLCLSLVLPLFMPLVVKLCFGSFWFNLVWWYNLFCRRQDIRLSYLDSIIRINWWSNDLLFFLNMLVSLDQKESNSFPLVNIITSSIFLNFYFRFSSCLISIDFSIFHPLNFVCMMITVDYKPFLSS